MTAIILVFVVWFKDGTIQSSGTHIPSIERCEEAAAILAKKYDAQAAKIVTHFEKCAVITATLDSEPPDDTEPSEPVLPPGHPPIGPHGA